MGDTDARPADVSDCYDLLHQFLKKFSGDSHGHWQCLTDRRPQYAWDDAVHNGRFIIKMGGSGTAYIEYFATVEWDKAKLHLTQEDWKTGAYNDCWDLPIPPDWLAAMKLALWPSPPATLPWF